MKNQDFANALRAMGYDRERYAQLVGVRSTTTVENWATGDSPVPGLVALFTEFLLENPDWRGWFERRRPAGIGAMRDDKKKRHARKKSQETG